MVAGERVLITEGEMLLITSHRFRYKVEAGGQGIFASIPIDAVSSCQITHTSNLWWLRGAGAAMALALYCEATVADPKSEHQAFIAGVVVAGLLVLVYRMTRRQMLTVASSSAKVLIPIAGMPFEKTIELVDTIENARADLRSRTSRP